MEKQYLRGNITKDQLEQWYAAQGEGALFALPVPPILKFLRGLKWWRGARATAKAAKANKYAFGLKNVVPKFADDIGATHLMKDPNWKSSFIKVINDPSSKIHFNLNGIDSKPYQMIMSPGRSGINWEMNALYQNKAAFERTIFHYGGKIYKGFDIFNIAP